MPALFDLTGTSIDIENLDDDLQFSNLSIYQTLADVCSFSFTLHPSATRRAMSNHVAFLQATMGKAITVKIREAYTFQGIIQTVQAQSDQEGIVSYEVMGQGLHARNNEVPGCASFEDKTLNEIAAGLVPDEGEIIVTDAAHTEKLSYTVVYNQTVFQAHQMLAARFGEWLWYDGQNMNLRLPDGDPVPLSIGQDLQQVRIGATIRHAQTGFAGFDPLKGEPLSATHQPDLSAYAPMMRAAAEAGAIAYGHQQRPMDAPKAATADSLTRMAGLESNAMHAATVVLTGYSHNASLNLGTTIEVSDAEGNGISNFIITGITHTAANENNYTNYITAVPAEIKAPPYAATYGYLSCQPMVAIVTDNEDENGVDYLRVRFAWQDESKQEKSPWIPVSVPHAGKDKGFRFLPEVGEEVLVDFIDGDPERPYVIGAVHTEKNKSGNDQKGNHVKVIGTRSGRRLEIDDEKGMLKLYDNFSDKTPKNALQFRRKDDETGILLESQKNNSNYTVISLSNEDYIGLGVVSGDVLIAEIRLDKDGKKITIASDGAINLSSGSINMDAKDIVINASGSLMLNGKEQVSMGGMELKAAFDTNASLEAGVELALSGGATTKLSGGAMTEIQAALVKIN